MDFLMADGFNLTPKRAQGGLMGLLFYNRRLSVAGALCHKVRTCAFFPVPVQSKTWYEVTASEKR